MTINRHETILLYHCRKTPPPHKTDNNDERRKNRGKGPRFFHEAISINSMQAAVYLICMQTLVESYRPSVLYPTTKATNIKLHK